MSYAPGRPRGAPGGPALLLCVLPLVHAGMSRSIRLRRGPRWQRLSLLPRQTLRLQPAPMLTSRMLTPRMMPGTAVLLPRMLPPDPLTWPRVRLSRLRLSCAVLLKPGASQLRLRPPPLMLPPPRPLPRRLRLLQLLQLPQLRPPLRLLPLVPLRPALPLHLHLLLGGRVRVLLPPGGFPRAAGRVRAASPPLAGPLLRARSLRPLSGPPTLGSPSMGVVLLPLMTPTAIPAARRSEGRPRRVLLLPPYGLPWSPVWWQPQDAPASAGLPGLCGPRDARCCVFDAEPLAARLQGAGRGMSLCNELGDVSGFHAAARYALASCLPNAPAGLCELLIFTDGFAAPPACPGMRLPGSAGLLSVLGAAGQGTTFWALCFMVLPALVMLFSATLWVTVTRWNWLPCSGPLFGW